MLWADSISIDQNNKDEKGRQVSIMGKIFRKARQVHAWLGEVVDGTDALREAATSRRLSRDQIRQSPRNEDNERAAEQVLRRTYWRRTWIVQELVLARRILVHYGDCQADWTALVLFIRAICGSGNIVFELDELRYNWDTIVTPEACFRLGPNIVSFQHTQCSDPRDKVYALLSLSQLPVNRRRLVVDYFDDVDVLEVLMRAFEVYGTWGLGEDIFRLMYGLQNDHGVSTAEIQKRIDERPGGLRNPTPALNTALQMARNALLLPLMLSKLVLREIVHRRRSHFRPSLD